MPPPVDAGEAPINISPENDQQTCSREIAEVISGKTGLVLGGDAVEKSAEPTEFTSL